MKTHKNLIVWNKSISFVTEVYNLTKKYPKEELFCIVSQIRRAAISIPANIAEGCARQSRKEYLRFLYISLSSASELDTHLIISSNLDYIGPEELIKFQTGLEEIMRMLTGLIKSLSNKNDTNP